MRKPSLLPLPVTTFNHTRAITVASTTPAMSPNTLKRSSTPEDGSAPPRKKARICFHDTVPVVVYNEKGKSKTFHVPRDLIFRRLEFVKAITAPNSYDSDQESGPETDIEITGMNHGEFSIYLQLLYSGDIVFDEDCKDELAALLSLYKLTETMQDKESSDQVSAEVKALVRSGKLSLKQMDTAFYEAAKPDATMCRVVVQYVKGAFNPTSLKTAMRDGREKHISPRFLYDLMMAFAECNEAGT
ncbi:Putative SKP1/BTB/POZ domain superfamily protein [Septoria linicola]|uniref:SKP1/BTB/POZ domain superfamily protein n=1 Tax=Septoria linicola TaxID=215465 RepID=A0A9Q9EM16_9PEZI|nr:Putative SKP1/BTB/POZ domain superfamily protein [Septoria linicola]